ncbi:TIGR02266 family protein [Sandaracinus amylolyticus]|uniref:TolA protein n=1 Tax=Sandaracinus amylolyticus TaxID=927083 RepID=A0A0F6VYP4_9BACT|nr:TIGR02266 family protein [Sandaracinus amylolyticus]AKF02871.1 TolA protein [Sandaracinus amylolyticus]
MADTRKDKRADVSLKVRYKSATIDEFIEQYAKDISRGGVFIKSKSPMPVGTLLKFEIQLKDESPLIHGVGRVVWKREASDSSDSPSGMGIKFIRMDPECRVMVDKIVVQRGEAPGQFEAGAEASAVGGAAHVGADEKKTSALPAAKSSSAPFFPTAGPTEAELPRPEDRTQVRHASEFLASALAEAGGDSEAAREAERKAEEARKRTEEIERERAAQRAKEAERERLEAEARDKAEAERAAKEKAEREKAEAAEKAAKDKAEREKAEKAAKEKEAAAAKAKAELGTAKTEIAPSTKKSDPAPAKKSPASGEVKPAAKKPESARPVAAAAISTDRPPPVEEPKSYVLPAIVGVVAVVALGAFFMTQGGSSETPETTPPPETAAAPTPPPEEPSAPEPVVAAEEEGAPAEVTALEEAAQGELLAAEAAPEPSAEEPAAPAVAPARFRVETTPPGATVRVDGAERGVSPVEVEAPVGTAVTITAALAGYREGTQQVTPTASQRPVRLTLAAMPYVIEVTTTPPGARVRAGARTATTGGGAPSRMTVGRATAPIAVTASRSGYEDATTTIAPTAFAERDGEMVATVSLTLTERPQAATPPPTATPRTPRAPREAAAADPGGESAGGGEAAAGGGESSGGGAEPAAEPARPEPAPEPAPAPAAEEPGEAPPENPFG